MDNKLNVLFVQEVSSELDGARQTKRMGTLEARLISSVTRRELQVHFQPQYEVDGGDGCGVEALARWILPDGEEISPTIFIPIAERIALIHPLGAWVLEQACSTVAAWGQMGGHAPTLSVNVSAHQIDDKFCGVIERAIKLSGLPAAQLELEITETALFADIDLAIECCEAWRNLGVHIAVDDFGTGYSSLNSLARLPVNRLKLDKSFAERMTFEKKTAAIVRSVLALGKEMGMAVLVEGVETEEQLTLLAQWGCRQVQGFLFAKPVPAAQAKALLLLPWGNRLAPILRAKRATSRGLHAA
jgi:EAL domain-containing protein (putative c-di-GMP-specific phosphodiesterase class I)